ncbi:O-antigen/teichoic acid export membrane protein [Mucilaginibacter sp. UYNi724]
MLKFKSLLRQVFKKDNDGIHVIDGKKRNLKLLVQLGLSFGYKGLSMILSFAIVPLSINLLGSTEYGLWLTIFSLVNFFLFFDLGLGNGLKNKITVALANNEIEEVKRYISTGYIVFASLSLILIAGLFLTTKLIDIKSFIDTAGISPKDVERSILTIGTIIIISFTLNFVYNIAASMQNISFSNLGMVLNNLITVLILITFNVLKIKANINMMAQVMAISLIVSMVTANIIFYKKNPSLLPALRHFRSDYLNNILKLSFGFFIVQIQVIVISFTDTIIINKYLGNIEVTKYSLVYKLFNAVIVMLSLISMPLWTVFTEAFEKKDNVWIKNVFTRFNYFVAGVAIVFILMGVFINPILYLWVQKNYDIPVLLITGMVVYHVLYAWNYNYSVFLNSISAIRVQLPYLFFTIIANIPLCIYFIHLNLGSAGVVLASAVCILPFSIYGPYVAYKRIRANT